MILNLLRMKLHSREILVKVRWGRDLTAQCTGKNRNGVFNMTIQKHTGFCIEKFILSFHMQVLFLANR